MAGERDEGQAAVELALVLPLLVLLLLAIVQVTLVARDQILVVHGARAGAREAAVDAEPAAVRQAVLGDGALAGDRTRIDQRTRGDDVTVAIDYRAATDVPLVGPLLPDVQLRAKAAMRRESGAP